MGHRIAVSVWILLACATAASAEDRRVVNMPFPIAGGQTIELPVTDGGPLPAESRDFKIEVAGFTVERSTTEPKQALLTWRFALTSKSSVVPEEIIIEEVMPSKVPVIVLHDRAPLLKAKLWLGAPEPVEASPTSTPWLFDEKASIYVFRFTIKPPGESATVLYQPAWFSKPAKEAFRQAIRRIHGS